MQILDVEQGSQEWLQVRAGLVTCSMLHCLFSGRGKSFSKAAISYMYELIGEQVTGEPKANFYGYHADRGHSHEPVAIELYEMQTGAKVNECGFIKREKIGYSPDGLVGSDGLIEIKSKLPKFQMEILYEQKIPSEHFYQCMGGILASERDWIDFISYCPSTPLFVKRLYRDEKVIKQINDRVDLFFNELEIRKQKILKVE